MYSFKNDYSEGAHPKVLEALQKTNLEQTVGYGADEYCEEARDAIRREIGVADADVHFFIGGTQANFTAITGALRPWQAVIGVETAHINVHETGAVEATGHKILAFPSPDGKLSAEQLHRAARDNTSEHMVEPAMAYVSNATETGTVYTREELAQLSAACKQLGFGLFVDGARLAQALYSEKGAMSLADIASLCDMFYIGGTKNGLLFGEALVITRDELKAGFRNLMKQRDAILAKGRLLGIQFLTMFREGLFEENARHALRAMANITAFLRDEGIELLYPSEANMCFPIFTKRQIQKLSETVLFEEDALLDGERQAIRLVTSWATKDEAIAALKDAVQAVLR